jgi:ubiquinone/menaquinone biosynthesis C-methylase UbiE
MLQLDETRYSGEQHRTREHFNNLSDYWYDIYQDEHSFTGYALRKQHRCILDLVAQTEGARRILDVGCGTGVTALELAQLGYEVSGLDIAPNMIQRARSEAQHQNLKCDFQVGIAENLPYPDAYFNVVIALGLLGNILEDKLALTEMARVLKPGGRLLLTIPNLLALDLLVALPKSLAIMLGASRFRRPLRKVANFGRRLIGREIKEISGLRFNQCVPPHSFIRHLYQQGFSNIRYYPLTFGPMMPFGLHLIPEHRSIQMSEKLVQSMGRYLGFMGTIIVYDGWQITGMDAPSR